LSKKTNNPEEYASDLLSPAVAFFKSLEMDLQQIQQIVAHAYNKVGNFKDYKKIDHSGNLNLVCAGVVSKWIRSTLFLDTKGQPKVLPLKGGNSFLSLVRAVDANCDAMQVLRVLMRYKTVEKIDGQNRYKLKAEYSKTNSDDRISINAATAFLWDANKTISYLLKRRVGKEIGDPFWFKAQIPYLTKKETIKFMTFMRERTMLFILEADDWLEARRKKSRTSGGSTMQRVGLGIFTFANSHLDSTKIA
jgi:hypothetical protein